MLTPRAALSLSLLSVAAFVGVNLLLFSLAQKPPKIQGVLVPEGRTLDAFSLVDHDNQAFTSQSLLGKWSLLSYGFTDCPDICPTTLNKLAQVEKKLAHENRFADLQILFYTVDPQRDTVVRLAQYVKFFSKNFVGLTYGPELGTDHVPLERSLGIMSSIDPLPAEEAKLDYKGYSVSHGVMLYLINPAGKLQAILKPEVNQYGMHFFDSEKVYRDYVSIRSYLE